jgi:hypothetical protein
MSDNPQQTGGQQTTRLVISWLLVAIVLVYALFQTIKSVLPLFGG